MHTLVVVALSTAARAGELLKRSWHDVELEQERAILRHTTNGEPRNAWLSGEALKLLQEHKARALHQERCERAGVRDFTFHCLRHTAATYLARLGASEQQLKAIGGWKSRVVSRYVHLAAEDNKALVARMNEGLMPEARGSEIQGRG